MTQKEENDYIKNNKLRFINFKLDTGRGIMDAKSGKDSEGCILNALPLLALKCLRRHVDEIIKFKEKEAQKMTK